MNKVQAAVIDVWLDWRVEDPATSEVLFRDGETDVDFEVCSHQSLRLSTGATLAFDVRTRVRVAPSSWPAPATSGV